ncbi:MAG: hypothetical protein H0W25_19435, partial [Acidimicrobiia bacterium]|nr:hypothetical protein [Acidimicrobiia bacterium]
GSVALAGLGIVGAYVAGAQQRAYDEGHAAYLEGNCANAVGPLGEAADDNTDRDLTARAQVEVEECELLLAADTLDTQGSQGDAVLAYSGFVTDHAASPIADFAIERGAALIAGEPPERLATVELCGALEELEAQRFVETPDDDLPPLLLACALLLQEEGDLAAALAALERVRSTYPDHEVGSAVDEAFVEIALAEAEASGAGELEQPEPVGPAGDPSGPTVVLIENASREPLTIVFNGAEQRVEEVAPCSDCDAESGEAACDATGPEILVELPPGTYEVLVRAASGADVIPFRGTWALDAGFEYDQCFFIVRQ